MESTNKTLVSAAGLVAIVVTFAYLYISVIDGYSFSSDPRNQNTERPAASSNASQGQISTTSVNSSSPIDIAAPGYAAAVEVLSGKSVGDDLNMFVPQENKQFVTNAIPQRQHCCINWCSVTGLSSKLCYRHRANNCLVMSLVSSMTI
jgi:hypothetical protein